MFNLWPDNVKPIIGMIHLRPLPGSPQFAGNPDAILRSAIADAEALTAGGAHGLMMENFGDAPFFPGAVPPLVIACMTAVACEIRRRFPLPLGINVLRNDGVGALSVALAAEAHFIRVNILCGARVTDQGVIQGIAHDLMRLRRQLHAQHIRVLADVDVKHSTPLGERRAIEDEVEDTIHRGLADGLIVSGSGTGKATDLDQVRRVKAAAGATPVFIGSGITAATVREALHIADGAIVGSWTKKDGVAVNPVDPDRVRALVNAM